MSEIERTLAEYGIDKGKDSRLSNADRDLIMRALSHYAEHLQDTVVTVRTIKPDGADRRAVAAYIGTVADRANLLVRMVDTASGVILEKCGEG